MMGMNAPLTSVKPVGANMTQVDHGRAIILYSYQTPVAIYVPGIGTFVTTKHHSVTTSKHIGKWGVVPPIVKVSQDEIEEMARSGEVPERNPTLAILGNPRGRRRKLATKVLAIDYVHAQDGKKYTHDFTEDTDHGPVCAYVEDGGKCVVLEASDGRAIVRDY